MKTNLVHLGAVCLLIGTLQIPAATLYVDVNSTNPTPPYADWNTAATNIQDAIDASTDGDLVLVTNGVYATGGRVVYGALTNRVVVNKAVTVQSVNGPAATSIVGNSTIGVSAVRCAFLVNGSLLSGFTLTNGGTLIVGDGYLEQCGGGVWTTNNSTATVSNCVLVGNAATQYGGGAYYGNIINSSIIQNSAYYGGGVAFSSVTNSLALSNSAVAYGGATFSATMNNCKVFSNIANFGGGGYSSSYYGCLVVSNTALQLGGAMDSAQSIVNCTIVLNSSFQGSGGVNTASGPNIYNNIIYFNTVSIGTASNYSGLASASYCCTTPMFKSSSSSGFNITNEPSFLDLANGDFHLKPESPCINSGGLTARSPTDLDGNPRVADGLLDIGAYESQTSKFVLPYYWAQQYGLPLDGSIDSDGDGLNNWQEAVIGTIPTNAASVLKFISVAKTPTNCVVRWQSAFNKIYFLQRSTNLAANPAFVSIYTNHPIPAPTLGYIDNSATNDGPYFYRVGVQ